MYERAVARKVSVKQVLDSEVHPSPGGYQPSYADINGLKAGRINLIATVIKEGGQVLLDDGTGMLPARAFDTEMKVENGDVVRVIGKVRENNQEKYLAVEIIRKLDDKKQLRLREKELGKLTPEKLGEKEEGEKTRKKEKREETREKNKPRKNKKTGKKKKQGKEKDEKTGENTDREDLEIEELEI